MIQNAAVRDVLLPVAAVRPAVPAQQVVLVLMATILIQQAVAAKRRQVHVAQLVIKVVR